MNWSRAKSRFKRRHQSKASPLLKGSLVLLLLIFVPIIHQRLFTFREITCLLEDQKSCPQAILQVLDQYQGKSLITFNQKKLTNLIDSNYPVKDIAITAKLPGRLITSITLLDPLPVNVYFSPFLPNFTHSTSSSSAQIISSLDRIERFLATKSSQSYQLQVSGELLPSQDDTHNTRLSLLFAQKPSDSFLENAYQSVETVSNILGFSKGFLINSNLFLRHSTLPDMIVSVTGSPKELEKILQSTHSLAKIKPEIKLIDLRFKQPLIY